MAKVIRKFYGVRIHLSLAWLLFIHIGLGCSKLDSIEFGATTTNDIQKVPKRLEADW